MPESAGAPTGTIVAVVSDFGGVLTTPLMASFLALQDAHGVSVEDFGAAMRAAATAGDGEIPLFKLERGDITEPEFLEALRDGLEPRLGHRPELHRFREIFFEALDPNEPMIELMRECRRGGLRMAMLTNNVQEWEPLWRTMLPVDEIFETVVDSGYVGYRKPERQIYEITLERLGLPATACLFVDDLEVNCEAAGELGFTAVHYRDADQAIAEVRAALAG
ncbi:MAG TPA: HAD family phosphatase [Solirubrobacterales bacterium]|jgi:epoxide hydrolase-like predicted phosphatase|nr:HAD family phosphatase [Solirubrobacterales bacterium]